MLHNMNLQIHSTDSNPDESVSMNRRLKYKSVVKQFSKLAQIHQTRSRIKGNFKCPVMQRF